MFANKIRGIMKKFYKNYFFYTNSLELNKMSPLDKFAQMTAFDSYSGVYEYWRVTRIKKVLSLFDIEELRRFKILELGSGNCEIGAFFASLGATVQCLEGRKESVNLAKIRWRNLSNLKINQYNLEEDFSCFGKFDLIIHFGLLYHISDPVKHIECCVKVSKNILLETLILDDANATYSIVPENEGYPTQSLIGQGSRPTISFIESLFSVNGYKVTRLFDRDLNSGPYIYDWQPVNDGKVKDCHYKMWHFLKL